MSKKHEGNATRQRSRKENSRKRNEIHERYVGTGLVVGSGLGIAAGAVVGLAMGNMSVGIAFGICVGTAVGVSLGSLLGRRRSRSAGES
jgi:hypothetical protein